MAKLSKKEWGYIGGVIVVSLIILWLLYRKGQNVQVLNGDGKTPDTSYLNFNMPPLNNDGLAMPQLGNVVVPPMNLNLGGGCNNCSQANYYSSPIELANALGDYGSDAVQKSLESMPNYVQVAVDQNYTAGSIDDVNRRVLSNMGALILPWTTKDTMLGLPVQAMGSSGQLTTNDMFNFANSSGTFDAGMQ